MSSSSTAYPLLFSPLTMGPLRLRNRVLLSPMTTGFGYLDGRPDRRILDYFAARSTGVAMAVVPFGAVRPEGRVEERIPWMWQPDAAAAMAPLAAAIADAGALPCLQLGHGGRQVSPRVIGSAPVAPSSLPPAVHVDVAPTALTTDQTHEIVLSFGVAAAAAAAAGFVAIELHAGHGYLVQQFLSGQSNLRTDRYGGATIAQRATFGLEVVDRIRSAAGELALLVRINGEDLVPDGQTVRDAATAAALFVDAGAHAIVVSGGVYGSVPYTIPLLDDPEATFLNSASQLRSAVRVPVVAVGRFSQPRTAEQALTDGDCDAVAVGRGLLADPDWVAKAAAGRAGDIRPCIATVEGCAGMLQHGEEISCTVNPDVGRERTAREPTAQRPARVIVIGGGPAGLEAARRAAESGHQVTLYEASRRLGGGAALAAITPPLAHFDRLVGWYERQLDRLGVDVRLGHKVEAAEVDRAAALIVVAVGGQTDIPAVDGYEHLPAWTTEQLLSGQPSSLGGTSHPHRPLVLGGGVRALATALWLVGIGAEPTLLCAHGYGRDTSGLARRAYLTRLNHRGVPLLAGHLLGLTPRGIRYALPEGTAADQDADGLVVCEPLRSRRWRTEALPTGAAVIPVGDARAPRPMADAIAEGRMAVDRLTCAG